MSIETFKEVMDDINNEFAAGSTTGTGAKFVSHTVRDIDFNSRALALVKKSIFKMKVDKFPITLKLNYGQLQDISREADKAERRGHYSARIYAQDFPKYGINNLDTPYIQINVNKIYDVERQYSRLRWIMSELSVILARGRGDSFFWNDKEHQEHLRLLQEAESLV